MQTHKILSPEHDPESTSAHIYQSNARNRQENVSMFQEMIRTETALQ